MNDRWYSGATRGMWLALAAALLGWMFDGFEMGVFPLVARPALLQLLNLEETDKQSKSLKEDIKRAKAIAESEAITPEDRAIAQKTVDDLTPQHKVLSTQLELVLKWNAVIYAAFLIGAALGGFVFGWIGDRIGRVRAMALSVLIYALFTGLCGLAMEAWHLAALRFIAALGMGGEWALGVALVMEKWPSRSRPVLAGLIGAAANFGFLLTGVIGLTFQTMQFPLDQSWRIILGLCVLPAVLTFFIRMFVPESEKWKEASTSGPKRLCGGGR
jgi:MFS family permease